MEPIAEWSLRFLDEHAQLALFVWLFLEEAGLPMPLPGDLIVLGAGTRLAHGRMDWAVALALVSIATVTGSSILYWLSRRGGRPLLVRFGRYLHLDADRLARSEAFLERRGFLAVVIGRLTPGLRVATTVAAGALGVPYRQFLPASLIGSNNLVLLMVGYFAGPEILRAVEGLRISTRLVGALAGIALVLAAYWVVRRRAGLRAAATDLPEPVRVETAVMAGLLGIATTIAAINVVLFLFTLFDQTAPAEALLELVDGAIRRIGPGPPAVIRAGGAVLYVVLHTGWALIYAYVEPRLPEPDWVGGLLYALVPLIVSLTVILPILGAGIAGFGLGAGIVPLAGETVRHAIFGWALSTSYTVLSRSRAPRRRRQREGLVSTP